MTFHFDRGPYSAIYFCTYEYTKRFMQNVMCGIDTSSGEKEQVDLLLQPQVSHISLASLDFMCGIFASVLAAQLTQPLDCVKTRIQVGIAGTKSKTTISILSSILEKEGSSALFRGSIARVLWLAPGGGITICVFEIVKRSFDDCDDIT